MCGRFTRSYTWRQVHDFLDIRFPSMEEMQRSWNVAPTQETPVCRLDDAGNRALAPMQWGLRPSWSKEGAHAPINARAETVATSPMFRKAFAQRRCLVPASGFYEWQKAAAGGGKQPYYIRLLNRPIMCFAGLWEPRIEGDETHSTFTILTTRSNELVADLHDRMPVILRPEQFSAWLNPGACDVDILTPFPAEEMEAIPVSPRVGSPKNDDPSLIEREGPATLFG